MAVMLTGAGVLSSIPRALSDYAIGESVFLNMNGIPVEFLIAHQGNPKSSIYHSSCNGTWLISKQLNDVDDACWSKWDSRNTSLYMTNYAKSTVHSFLNNTVLKTFDSAVQSKIKQVYIPYSAGFDGDDTSAGGTFDLLTGSSGLKTKVFLLSAIEVGFPVVANKYYEDGAPLAYFSNAGSTNASRITTRISTNEASQWYTRSPRIGSQYEVAYVTAAGALGTDTYSASGVHRIALILPKTVKFNSENEFMG